MTAQEQRRMLDEEQLSKTRPECSNEAVRRSFRLVEELVVVLVVGAVAEFEGAGETGVGGSGGGRVA
jgi:hypothetical protein